MTEPLSDAGRDESAIGAAFAKAGMTFRDETPQQAAQRIWRDTKGDPVETMKRFDSWALADASRIIAILGPLWHRAVRNFLERDNRGDDAWACGDAFRRALIRRERRQLADAATASKRQKLASDPALRQRRNLNNVRYNDRQRRGIKVVHAEVSVATGAVVNLIDKEYGPFAHIRINGLALAEVTTEQALRWCDNQATDVRFVRALCHLVPDPRKPIGEQWTTEMIRDARRSIGE